MGLLFFVFAAMNSLAPTRDHVVLATAITRRVESEPPLFKGDDDKRRTASYLVAVAFREGSLTLGITGNAGFRLRTEVSTFGAAHSFRPMMGIVTHF